MRGVLQISNGNVTVIFTTLVNPALLKQIDLDVDLEGYIKFKNGQYYEDPLTKRPLKITSCVLTTIKVTSDVKRVFPIDNTDESIRYIVAELKLGPYKE
jgi:hypothetical protein